MSGGNEIKPLGFLVRGHVVVDDCPVKISLAEVWKAICEGEDQELRIPRRISPNFYLKIIMVRNGLE